MTTVAWKPPFLAADSAVSGDGAFYGSVAKIARSPCGALGGATGRFVDCADFLRWVEGGMEGHAPDAGDDLQGLVVMPDGELRHHMHGGWYGFAAPFYAMGCGSEIAMGAMAAGASAEEAVRIACEFDTNTRGPVMVMRLGEG